ncbi:hypothetical protein B0T14DRAFT_504643 [Immersiella caudata]|uniref:Uncharacterized protein n=1 Tax=Immersiella caudata TaxID=314043 RepID=A0AA40CBR9_9PEZI|nr:hypothetical protein B0T14DRAFT_504643 [Immersiella caudata]
MVITLAFLGLYLANVQWDANSTQIGALLYLAKIHESLIVISLSNILYHRLRYHMLRAEGVSYGFITSPFQINNPLYLFSKTFRSSCKASCQTWSDHVTAGLVVLSVVLAILAAPRTGTSMLPRLNWWAAAD